MEYNQIAKFLDKFKKIFLQKEKEEQIIFEIIKKHTNFLIKKNLIKIKNANIFIEGSPVFKNEVFLHKEDILSDLKKILPNSYFKDIK